MNKLTRRNLILGISKYGIVGGLLDQFLSQIVLERFTRLYAQTPA